MLCFLSFAFFSMKKTSNNIISTHLKSSEIGPQLLYCRKIHLERKELLNDTDRQHEITDTSQKSVHIPYLCLQLFVHMYLLPDSRSISIPVCNPVESTGIGSHSTGFHRNDWSLTGIGGHCKVLQFRPMD